jgi:hypothetical protein
MIPESVQAVQKISSILATDLKKEQSETEKYERFLENALIGGEVNDTDIPDISCLPPWSVFDSSDQSIPGDHVLVEGFSEPLVTDELDRFKRELDTNRRERHRNLHLRPFKCCIINCSKTCLNFWFY